MKNNHYYDADPGEVPDLSRVDFMGHKLEDVITDCTYRTFQQAKTMHRKNLKDMIKECERELARLNDLKVEDLPTAKIW